MPSCRSAGISKEFLWRSSLRWRALLGAQAVAERLGDGVLEPSPDRRDVAAKHRTLRATLEWSYGLFTPEEQLVLRRPSVFAGGCTHYRSPVT
jgi:predicted ATPase